MSLSHNQLNFSSPVLFQSGPVELPLVINAVFQAAKCSSLLRIKIAPLILHCPHVLKPAIIPDYKLSSKKFVEGGVDEGVQGKALLSGGEAL